jgi:hypothetical protein
MNSAYHYSDVLTFMSGSNLVMFDPHGKSLPDNHEGLRCDLEASGWPAN